ncbi:MAG: CheY-like chemotaxis protein [Myxococcota bacterium]
MSYQETGYLTILAIDDDPAIRQLVTGLLVGEGHQVIAVDSAEAGLEQLPFFTFEIAFLDHHLPGMEGLVLGEYLRKNNPKMLIALVTGGADAQVERMAEEHGIILIHKPFEMEQLLEVVERAAATEHARTRRADEKADTDFTPRVWEHHEALPAYFEGFNVPRRVEDHLGWKIRAALDAVKFSGGDDEQARVAAYAGLLAAEVLGIKLPRHKDGQTLYETYDGLMNEFGKRAAFSEPNGG